MKKSSGNSVNLKLQRFLFSYRTLPHSTTGVSPGELLMGRRLKTALDFLKPCRTKKTSLGSDIEATIRTFPVKEFS